MFPKKTNRTWLLQVPWIFPGKAVQLAVLDFWYVPEIEPILVEMIVTGCLITPPGAGGLVPGDDEEDDTIEPWHKF